MMPTSLRTLIDAALHATTVEDVHALCSRLCQELGFDYFIYGAQLPTSLIKPRFVIVSGYPQEWRQHYKDNGYTQSDPTVAHCIGHVTPLLWSDVTRRDNPFTAEARRFMHEAHDFGLRNGVSFPVHGVSGESAMLSLACADDRPPAPSIIDDALPVGHLLSSYIHEAVRRVFVDNDSSIAIGQVQLTEREKECLTWAAEGKTTWETSHILGISERTVIFHLRNVALKLNVSNRSQAVARAVSQLLITPRLG